jgi:hypothetical protein
MNITHFKENHSDKGSVINQKILDNDFITAKNIPKNKSGKKIFSNKTNDFETRYENHTKNLIVNLNKVNHDVIRHNRSKIEQSFQSNDLQNVYNNSKLPKVVILTHFRSGSSFLGDLLSVNSDTFYSFEPFRYIFDEFGKHEITNDETINLIKPLFKCESKKLVTYINWFKKDQVI